MSNPIDLGKLQAEQYKAEALVRSATRVLDGAWTKHENALQALDNAKKKCKAAHESLDKARQAVLDGARSIAQG